MGQSLAAYLKTAKGVRSVRQIHAVTTAICEDLKASAHLKRKSLALTRKLEQIINLSIARAPFLASIWRDFSEIRDLLEKEQGYEKPTASPERCCGHRLSPACQRKGAVSVEIDV
jgi:hypothetical protein